MGGFFSISSWNDVDVNVNTEKSAPVAPKEDSTALVPPAPPTPPIPPKTTGGKRSRRRTYKKERLRAKTRK
jgi:hypothetical protein